MTADTSGSTLSRRRLLGGGMAGAGALALAGCITDPDPPDAIGADRVWVARVDEVPADDPDSGEWKRAVARTVALDAQLIALPNRREPAVPEVTVRAVHDGRWIAFLLRWRDEAPDDLTVQIDHFRDACAVLLGGGAGDQTIRTMGTAGAPVALLHWKADWQRDMELGIQGQAEVFPNRCVDVYPPLLLDVPRDVTADDYRAAGATQWLPGLHVGNPLSADTRPTCVEKLLAAGYGTSTHAGAQDAVGAGRRSDGGWRVVIAKPLAATEEGEPSLSPGSLATCAFAVWSGSTRDAGGRKSPSATAFILELEA